MILDFFIQYLDSNKLKECKYQNKIPSFFINLHQLMITIINENLLKV